MSIPLFIWIPDTDYSGSHEPRVFTVNFGDGYTERAPNGINTDLRTWDSIPFTVRSQAEAFAIETFLKVQGAVTAFNWQVPQQDLALVICTKFSTPIPSSPNSWSMTATFVEVPA